jgi:hypothetical protein
MLKFSFDPDPETGYRDDYDDFLAQVHEEEDARKTLPLRVPGPK